MRAIKIRWKKRLWARTKQTRKTIKTAVRDRAREKRAFYIARGAFMHQKADAEPKADKTTNKRVKKPRPPEEDDPRGQVGTFLRQPRRR